MRKALATLAVILAALAGAGGTLAIFELDRDLTVGTVRLKVSPLHPGSFDLYVPVVDWGIRFTDAVRMPARLEVDVRAVDRGAVARLARGESLDVDRVRIEARDAIASYIRQLLAAMAAAALAAGALVALAVRHHHAPRLRVLLVTAAATAVAAAAATAVTLPPRGALDEPEYFAFGPDIPRALDAIESVRRSADTLDQELNAQLVGLARLVVDPSQREPLDDAKRLTIASDLHNNVPYLQILERAARGGPILFPGDLTDRGATVEIELARRIVRAGKPLVFVTGNHDSDATRRELARDGAVVLTEDGRLNRDGTLGPVVVTVAGIRMAGYSDPFERRESEDFEDRYEAQPGPERQLAFADWLRPLSGQVDVVLVHDPNLIKTAVEELQALPPAQPIVFAVGHSHDVGVTRTGPVTVLNGGSIGAGGTGNLADETRKPIGLATLSYATEPAFRPLAADLVTIDPGTGNSTARRERLDESPAPGRGA